MPNPRVALETTLLVHGVPTAGGAGGAGGVGRELARRLAAICREEGAEAAIVGVLGGRPIVGMSDAQVEELLGAASEPRGRNGVAKLNTGNLGPALFRREHGATTVSATMELAAKAGLSVFATGGLGGVHPVAGGREVSGGQFDISADLHAFTRFPIAVVTSGVKSILDIAATREVLETLGVCVVGYQTDEFPAFYMRESDRPGVGRVDARFDDAAELARFVRFELARSGRGIVVCNPIPAEREIAPGDWRKWLAAAEERAAASGAVGRGVTPAVLGALHEVSDGATLRANIALVESNTRLAAKIAVG